MPTVDINGLRVNYTDAGTGLPLIFVPGLLGSKEWFGYQVSGLGNHHRIISYDLRFARGRVDYSLDLLTADLTRFLDRLKIHGAVVIGHSFGALIAARFAALHPERTLALVAISAAPSFRNIQDEELLSRFSAGEVESESFFTRFWKRIFSKAQSFLEDSDPLVFLAQHRADIDRATLSARLNILRETDLSPILPEIVSPTLIIAGSMEWSRILSGSQLMDECIPDSTLEIIEDTGHFSFFTRHDIFNSILEDFLNHKVRRV